jgi:hypothetical protein
MMHKHMCAVLRLMTLSSLPGHMWFEVNGVPSCTTLPVLGFLISYLFGESLYAHTYDCFLCISAVRLSDVCRTGVGILMHDQINVVSLHAGTVW